MIVSDQRLHIQLPVEFILEIKPLELSYFTSGIFLKGEIRKVVTKIITIESKERKRMKKCELSKALDFYFPIFRYKICISP